MFCAPNQINNVCIYSPFYIRAGKCPQILKQSVYCASRRIMDNFWSALYEMKFRLATEYAPASGVPWQISAKLVTNAN